MRFFKRSTKPPTQQKRLDVAVSRQLMWKRIAVVFMIYSAIATMIGIGIYRDHDITPKDTQAHIEEPVSILEAPKVIEEVDTPSEPVEEIIEAPVDPIAHIRKYRDARGGVGDEYLNEIYKQCGDVETTERVIAISVAECGGHPSTCDRSYNMWGYFLGGDRSYDPDMKTMASVICGGIGTYYDGVESNRDMASRYTGGDSTETWMSNVSTALYKMRELK